MRDLFRRWFGFSFLVGLMGAAVVHVGYTLAVPMLANSSPYDQLRGGLAVNAFQVLPPARPGQQVLPFMAPDMMHAVCPFELGAGQLLIKTRLPEAGWALSLIEPSGNVFYSVGGERERVIDIDLVLVPPAEKLFGFWPQSRGPIVDPNLVASTVQSGLLILSAPVKGQAFAAEAEALLKAARCSLRT